jgi:hypothetical protein
MLDLEKLAKKIYESTGFAKTAEVSGIKYTFRLHSQEQQTILDAVYQDVVKLPEESEERTLKSKELTNRAISYALTSVEGEEVPDTFSNGEHRDLALTASIATWPEIVTDVLFKVVLNMRAESTRKLRDSVKFEWYLPEDTGLEMPAAEAEALALEEQKEASEQAAATAARESSSEST